jgi:hypothetical protein
LELQETPYDSNDFYETHSGTNGSGDVVIDAGHVYSFLVVSAGPDTVNVDGTLYYNGPLLGLASP